MEADPATPGKKVEDKLGDEAEGDDPDVDKEAPELVLKSKRIFQQKYWNVFCDDDRVREKHQLMIKTLTTSL